MGAFCSNSKQKKAFFDQDQESLNSLYKIDPNLDLPYRHYIKKNYFIASQLPHKVRQYSYVRKIKISQDIEQSSIMKRRKLVNSSQQQKIIASIEKEKF